MEKIILIRSSSRPEPYEMRFSPEGDDVKLRCYCPAGTEQMLCKHVIALVSSDRGILFNPSDDQLFDEALLLLKRVGATEYCRQMLTQIDKLEREFKKVKKQFDEQRRELKDELCSSLREGRRFE
jgi:uncharacterized Zn finger protein